MKTGSRGAAFITAGCAAVNLDLPIQIVKAIQRRVYHALSLERMSGKFGVLALNMVFLMAYFNLEGIFVNTLLLRVSDGDMRTVLVYRAVTFAFSALGIWVATLFSGKINSVIAIKIGCILYAASFVILFFGAEHITSLMYVVGALVGAAGGVYFLGHNMLLTHYTTPQNRALGLAIMTIIQGSMALLMPLVSGLVIGAIYGMLGYRIMFGVAIGAIITQISFARKLSPVATTPKKGQLRAASRLILGRFTLRLTLLLEFFRGLREGVFTFFLSIVLFEIVASESIVGVNAFLAGGASIVAAWLYGRIATPRNRAGIAGICALAAVGFCALLLLSLNPFTIILLSIVNAFLAMLVMNCVNNTTFDIFAHDEASRSVMAELMAFRELPIQLGRLGGIVAVGLFPATLRGYVHAMLALSATILIVALLLHIIRRVKENEAKQESTAVES